MAEIVLLHSAFGLDANVLAWADRLRAGLGESVAGRVQAGFPLGPGVAQIMALTDPAARGLVLMHGAVAPRARTPA